MSVAEQNGRLPIVKNLSFLEVRQGCPKPNASDTKCFGGKPDFLQEIEKCSTLTLSLRTEREGRGT